jgi:acyl-CoA thioester hydrolase
MQEPQPDVFPFRFYIRIPIRYADIDAQRHLNNVAYFTFMEQARVEYMRAVKLWQDDHFDSIGMIVAEASCSYKAPAYLGETVTVWARICYVGTKSFHFEYRLDVERGQIASGRTVQVCYDYLRKESTPLPDQWRQKIALFEPGIDLS